MNIDEIITKNKILEDELQKMKDELTKTKEHLKKYTAPSRSKTYYENHKETITERVKKYNPSPEQKKERNRKAYLKRKEKMEEMKHENI